MLRHLVLWQLPFRVASSCDADEAGRRIQSLIAREGGGIGISERLVGRIDGRHLRLWRAAPLAQLGDTVELAGELRDEGTGSMVEGVLRYRLRTRVQFIGCLLVALAIALVGLLRWHAGTPGGGDLLGIGAAVAAATLLWIYSSRQMVERQAGFIRARLEGVLGDGKTDRANFSP
ncbi:MAG: hypothetical protein R3286_06395 [Gammaproteobacteria bacterium]|nr:hypothetical protein [Gammaproteobacteria bacterium]